MEPTEENIRAWNDLHRRWAEAWTVTPGLPDEVRALLPEVAGRHVLHVRCGAGEASAELAEAGGLVTGIDFDEEALAAARERAPNALFVAADIEELPPQLRRRRFHVVFCGPGLLDAVRGLESWAAAVGSALRVGGRLVVHDRHPVAACVDPASLRWRASYFELPWRLGEVLTAVVAAGLVLERFAELPPPTAPRRQDPRVPGEFALLARKP